MAICPQPWMKPGDLILFSLDQLPWPAYLRLTEAFWNARGFLAERLACPGDIVEYRLQDPARERSALLHVVPSTAPVGMAGLDRLSDRMQSAGIRQGYLFTPGSFSPELYLRAADANVELYSGNKLRVRIESLRADLRRQVLDAIGGR